MVLISSFRMDSVHGADLFSLAGTLDMVLISTGEQLWQGADFNITTHWCSPCFEMDFHIFASLEIISTILLQL